MRATVICWFIRSSAAASKRFCSVGSVAKALTTLMPARFSCKTVLSVESFCCTLTKSGCVTPPKTMNMTMATGRIGRITSVSCRLVKSNMISAPVRSTTAWTASSRP